MATDAQIQANRKNASKSTGPKTAKGKSKTRGNALKHGERAKTLQVMPVLPNEDPKLLEKRIQSWLDDWQPRDGMEDGLVRWGAELTWLLERGERYEVAHLVERAEKKARKAGPAGAAERIQVVNELGRRLFYNCRPETSVLRAGASLARRAGRVRRRGSRRPSWAASGCVTAGPSSAP